MSKPLTISGVQEAQRANLRAIAALHPTGAFGRAIQLALSNAHRYAVVVTHRKTGALAASHRIEIDSSGLRGNVFIDPAAINPDGGKPSRYGPVEHARGGEHAFYERVIIERGNEIAAQAMSVLVRSLGGSL